MEDEDEEARARRRKEETCSEDEGIMALIIDKLFNNAEQSPDDANAQRSHVDLSVELDAANIAQDGEDELETDQDDVKDGEHHQGDNVGSNEVIVGSTQRPISIHLANVNELCFIDIEATGRRILECRNPKVIRFNCHEQGKRKLNFYSEVHANLERSNEGDDIFKSAFSRFIHH